MNTNIETPAGTDTVMDVRSIPCSVKHPLLVKTFLALPVNGSFTIVNDHDPVRLIQQFSAQWPDAFTCEYLAKGPEDFRVKITKLKLLENTTSPAPLNCGSH